VSNQLALYYTERFLAWVLKSSNYTKSGSATPFMMGKKKLIRAIAGESARSLFFPEQDCQLPADRQQAKTSGS
jgi:hypothetical protein